MDTSITSVPTFALLHAQACRVSYPLAAGDRVLICVEAGPEHVRCALETPTSVLVCIRRRVHAQLQRKWPAVQFQNYSDVFLPDQDISVSVQLPCACAAPQASRVTRQQQHDGSQSEMSHALGLESLGAGKDTENAAMVWIDAQYIEGFHVLELHRTAPAASEL